MAQTDTLVNLFNLKIQSTSEQASKEQNHYALWIEISFNHSCARYVKGRNYSLFNHTEMYLVIIRWKNVLCYVQCLRVHRPTFKFSSGRSKYLFFFSYLLEEENFQLRLTNQQHNFSCNLFCNTKGNPTAFTVQEPLRFNQDYIPK